MLRLLETHDKTEAGLLARQIEQRIKYLRDGILMLPDGASKEDLWEVLRHGRPDAESELDQNRLAARRRRQGIAQHWRNIKTDELKIVSLVRGGSAPVDYQRLVRLVDRLGMMLPRSLSAR